MMWADAGRRAAWLADRRATHQPLAVQNVVPDEHVSYIVVGAMFELGAEYDQLNLGSLACFEVAGRRLQAIMEAHRENPMVPEYESADYYLDEVGQRSAVAPVLRAHVATQMKQEAEVRKNVLKTRELRTSGQAAPKKAADKK
eukprot:6491429-Amphidinium_carterae.4